MTSLFSEINAWFYVLGVISSFVLCLGIFGRGILRVELIIVGCAGISGALITISVIYSLLTGLCFAGLLVVSCLLCSMIIWLLFARTGLTNLSFRNWLRANRFTHRQRDVIDTLFDDDYLAKQEEKWNGVIGRVLNRAEKENLFTEYCITPDTIADLCNTLRRTGREKTVTMLSDGKLLRAAISLWTDERLSQRDKLIAIVNQIR